MRIVQINLNHCRTAQDILWRSMSELKADIALISEPCTAMDTYNWLTDAIYGAVIWTPGNKALQNKPDFPQKGYTWAKVDGLFIVSCYAPPRMNLDEFADMMTRMATDFRHRRPLIIAGDFNAWSTTWGSLRTNPRGRILEETFASLDLTLLNAPGCHTFDTGTRRSVIDLAFADRVTANRVQWQISSMYTHSDHHAIIMDLYTTRIPKPTRKVQRVSWKKKAFDAESFLAIWSEAYFVAEPAEQRANQVAKRLEEACDAAMPRRRGTPNWEPAYWWTDEIAELRKRCIKTRRRAQRARHRPSYFAQQALHKEARHALQQAIQQSKSRCFIELRNSADTDPWGKAYKMVMKKARRPKIPQPTCPVLLEMVVSQLFPPQSPVKVTDFYLPPPQSEEYTVSKEEVLAALSRISDAKAPGPDGVPNIAFKAAVQASPDIFAELYSECIKSGIFPRRWKRQRLVLLLKPGKLPKDPSAYRPLCLLDTVGKILERVICERLQKYLEGPTGLAERQFGFRREKSTVDAIRLVTEIASEAINRTGGAPGSMKYCAVVTLDIKNAFNSANWTLILSSLSSLGVPSYLLRIIQSYFEDRILEYDTDDGPRKYTVTGGVPQGSVLGPTLWNAMYDGILKMKLPMNATLVGYADDIALVVAGKHIIDVELTCNDAIARIERWLYNAKLQLAAQKTEAVLLSKTKKRESLTVNVGGLDIQSKPAIKYLGVMIDSRMTFREHAVKVSMKGATVTNALTRLLPNIGGAQGARRRLISTVTDSILLYAAPIWSQARKAHLREARQVYRVSALRVACAYRTVSEDAICVIAGKIPLDIRARELNRLYPRQGAKPTRDQKLEQRIASLNEWQRRWDLAPNGRWTHELIPNLATWLRRRHGEVDYFLSQMLSGHGCFQYYLHRFGLSASPRCPTCPEEFEDARHVLFHCPRFAIEREELTAIFGRQLSETNLTGSMCSSKRCWDATCKFSKQVLRTLRKQDDERRTIELLQQRQLEVNNIYAPGGI